MPEQNAYIEKRQHERLSTRIKVSYHIIAEGEAERLVKQQGYQDIAAKELMTVVSENISAGGMMIVGEQPFVAGTSMQLEVTLPQTPLPLKCLAVVVRGSESAEAGRYSAGLKFLAINKDDVAKIQRYIILQKRAEMDRRG